MRCIAFLLCADFFLGFNGSVLNWYIAVVRGVKKANDFALVPAEYSSVWRLYLFNWIILELTLKIVRAAVMFKLRSLT